MNRRGFLKLFGLGAVALSLPKTLLEMGKTLKGKIFNRKIKPVGKIRNTQEYITRHCNCEDISPLSSKFGGICNYKLEWTQETPDIYKEKV